MNELKITDVRCQKGDSAFLIDDGETAVLYDTGFGFTGYAVAENIRKVLGERPLDYIFLSHSHYDHALGSAYILRHYPDAKVAAGRYTAEIFRRDGAKRIMREMDAKFAAACGVTDYEFLGDELRVDIACGDGDIIKAGNMTFEVINLPGHTKCSVGYYCRERGLLLSSETLGVYDGGTMLLSSFLVSYEMALESIGKVKKLPIKNIVAPHYGLLSAEQTAYFLDNMERVTAETADEILEALKRGDSTETILAAYKEKYWLGYIRDIYPEDAVNLNTSITIELIRKELM